MDDVRPDGPAPDRGSEDPDEERIRLLISLDVDGEATPEQRAEIERHLPRSAQARQAREAYLAVRDHLARTGCGLGAVRLAERVMRAALEERRLARAAHRMLVMASAAAIVVAVAAWNLRPAPRHGGAGLDVADSTRLALTAGLLGGPGEGR